MGGKPRPKIEVAPNQRLMWARRKKETGRYIKSEYGNALSPDIGQAVLYQTRASAEGRHWYIGAGYEAVRIRVTVEEEKEPSADPTN